MIYGPLASRPTKAVAALLKDLKQRGLLDSHVGALGGDSAGCRSHNSSMEKVAGPRSQPARFTVWMAGGG